MDCSWDLDSVPSRHNLPTPKAYHILLRGGVPTSFDDNRSYGDFSSPVVIDSGASLSISPDKPDFVEHIQPLNLALGGIARGI